MRIAAFDSLARVTGPKLVDRLNAGVNVDAFTLLASAIDVPATALAFALGLSPRTLHNRERLSGDETERAFRAYRVLVRARDVFESEDGARQWMRTEQRALGNRTPLSMLVRDVGGGGGLESPRGN